MNSSIRSLFFANVLSSTGLLLAHLNFDRTEWSRSSQEFMLQRFRQSGIFETAV